MQRCPIFRAGLLFHVVLKQVHWFDKFFHICPEWQLHSGSGSGSGSYESGSGSGSGSGSWFAQYILTIVIFNM